MRSPALGTGPAWMSQLLIELLDASADTVELMTGDGSQVRCTAHLEYLRALHRKGQELLALAEDQQAR